jgi:hypothetical protein
MLHVQGRLLMLAWEIFPIQDDGLVLKLRRVQYGFN